LADGDKVKTQFKSLEAKAKKKEKLIPFSFSWDFAFDLDFSPMELAENCLPQGAKSQDVILRDDKPGRRISPTREKSNKLTGY